MNNIREKFEAFDSSYYSFLDAKPTYEKLAVFEKQDPNTIIYADHAVQVRFLNFTAAWQAATEQSQKEIAELQASEKVLVEAIRNCLDWANGRQAEWGTRAEKSFEFLEQALANVRGE